MVDVSLKKKKNKNYDHYLGFDNNDDYYQYDNKNQWIVGQRTGRKFQFGDTLEVVVISADIIKRQIDLSLLETETMKSFRSKWEKGKSKKSEASKKSGGGRKTRRGSK